MAVLTHGFGGGGSVHRSGGRWSFSVSLVGVSGGVWKSSSQGSQTRKQGDLVRTRTV